MERLIELVNHLPADARLSTTPEFEQAIGRRLVHASILQACDLVIDAGYQDNAAELPPDRKTIKVYAGRLWVPLSVFTVEV
jgi:hypothetical protein